MPNTKICNHKYQEIGETKIADQYGGFDLYRAYKCEHCKGYALGAKPKKYETDSLRLIYEIDHQPMTTDLDTDEANFIEDNTCEW